jgi:hypothetical protein
MLSFERMFYSSPWEVAQNQAQSLCSFLAAHYGKVTLDIAVGNHGPLRCYSPDLLSSLLEPTVRCNSGLVVSSGVPVGTN